MVSARAMFDWVLGMGGVRQHIGHRKLIPAEMGSPALMASV